MEALISLFVESVFINNILLALFLGMCTFLACSKNIFTAHKLGLAVIFVLSITVPTNWLINHFLLSPGALAWMGLPTVDLSFLHLVVFIATIAAMVQIVEMVHHVALYGTLPSINSILYSVGSTCGILVIGYLIFRKYQARIVEEL